MIHTLGCANMKCPGHPLSRTTVRGANFCQFFTHIFCSSSETAVCCKEQSTPVVYCFFDRRQTSEKVIERIPSCSFEIRTSNRQARMAVKALLVAPIWNVQGTPSHEPLCVEPIFVNFLPIFSVAALRLQFAAKSGRHQENSRKCQGKDF